MIACIVYESYTMQYLRFSDNNSRYYAIGRQEGWPLTSPEHYLDKQYSLKTFWYRKLPILSLPDSRIPF